MGICIKISEYISFHHAPVVILYTMFSVMCITCSAVVASTPPPASVDSWLHIVQEIQQQDAKIRSSQIVWNVRVVNGPHHIRDFSKYLAEQTDRMRADHASERQIQEYQKFVSGNNAQMGSTWTVYEQFKFEYDGTNFYCDVPEQKMTGGAIKPTTANQQSHFVNWVYGGHAIQLDGLGSAVPKQGTLSRPEDGVLDNCANGFGDTIFLVGTPVLRDFVPAETRYQAGGDDTVVLKRTFQNPVLGPTRATVPVIAYLVVSRKIWRPTVMTAVLPDSGQVLWTCRLSGYRRYPGGIWFPSHMSNDSAGAVEECDLVKAAFNGAAKLTHLKAGIAPGTQLSDYRFPKHPVVYTVATHVPTDREVLSQIAKDQQESDSARVHQVQTVVQTVVLVAGSIALALFIVSRLVRRRRSGPGSANV